MLYLLFLITLIFLILNYKITKKDLLHPSVIFCFMFFLYSLLCVLNRKHFAISLHSPTIIVITVGLIIFSSMTYIFFSKTNNEINIENNAKKIEIPNNYVVALIVFQILTIFFFIVYLTDLSTAYDMKARSLSEMISLFDTMTKFWIPIFNKLAVPVPMLYRIGNPLTTAGAYIMLYVMIHNFVIDRKINLLHLISVLLLCVLIVLNGSRSPLFRVITMAIVLYYIFAYKSGQLKIGNRKNLYKFAVLGVVIVLLFIGMLFVMGRSDKMGDLPSYLFIYIGAPIVNLDTWIVNATPHFIGGFTHIFGEQTFRTFYTYIERILPVSGLAKGTIDYFTFSSNGIEIGNVYTMYYKYIYDFGYIGIIPLTAIMAFYYIKTYSTIQNDKTILGRFSLKLFIFAYLFNDLMMSTFSTRFYETAMDGPFIKLLIVTALVKVFYFDFNKVKAWAEKPIYIKRKVKEVDYEK